MNIKILVKKIGNHWYPAINHNDVQEIVLDDKIEKFLSYLDINKTGVLSVLFTECDWVTENTLFFKDEDINRYFITNDNFDLSCFIRNHEFKISSKLYCLLEREFNFSFHILTYDIHIYSYEI